MERYFKARERDVESTACSSSNAAQKKIRVSVEFYLKDIIADPGLRKPIEEYALGVRDQVRREYLMKGPCQPIGLNFPRKQQGNHFRSFREAWFLKFDWLEYSVEKDAAYCFYCYLFKHPSDRFGSNVFTISGFNNWKKALQAFNEHVGGVNSDHNKAVKAFQVFNERIGGVNRDHNKAMRHLRNQRESVSHVLSCHSKEREVSHRARLIVLHVARFLILQGIPFYGLDECNGSLNRGNFLEFLSWYEEHVHNESALENNLLTSPQVQKDLARACVEETRQIIVDEIGDSNFSLLLDEAYENLWKQQMAVIVRFVNYKGQVIERFLCLEHVIDYSSSSLKGALDSLFSRHGLSISKLRGQAYNGASNIGAHFDGLKTLILNENPCAFYVHCFAHPLQLIVVSVAKNIFGVFDFFRHVDLFVTIMGTCCKRKDSLFQKHPKIKKTIDDFKKCEIFSGTEKQEETSLARIGDIRWGSYHTTLILLFSMWESVLDLLQIICDDDNDKDQRGIAYRLLQKMETFEFIFILHLMIKVFGLINGLSLSLQHNDQTIINAMDLIVNVKDLLLDMRENGWDSLLKGVKSFCNEMAIPVPNMEDSMPIRGSSRQARQFISYYHHYHAETFIAVIDVISIEMNNRFSETSTELLRCIACLDPRNSFAKYNRDMLLRLAEIYSDDFSMEDRIVLKQQLDLYIHHIRRSSDFSNCHDLANLAVKMVQTDKHLVFTLVYRLIELALILPVAKASVERAFWAMNIIKRSLEDEIRDEWWNDTMICYIERDIFKETDDEKILQHFQNMQT